jgi:hypothetical protein
MSHLSFRFADLGPLGLQLGVQEFRLVAGRFELLGKILNRRSQGSIRSLSSARLIARLARSFRGGLGRFF